MDPIVITRYRAMQPGIYRPQAPPRDVTVTLEDMQDWVDAVNMKAAVGAPVTLKFTHSEGLDAIEVGILSRAWLEGDAAFVDIVIHADAIHRGETIRTRQQLAEGLRLGMMTCSWEGWYNYSSPAYGNGRKFRIYPTGYAILPGSEQPAIPSAIPAAANDNTDPAGIYLRGIATAPVRGEYPLGKGEDTMTLEQAMAKIAELEAQIAEMEKAADKGKDAEVTAAAERVKAAEAKSTAAESELAKYRQAEADALKVKCADLTKTVAEKLLPAKREAFAAKLSAMDSDATRVQFLEFVGDSIPELTPEQVKLAAGDAEADSADPQGATVKAAERLAEAEKITYTEALKRVIADKNQEA